jgi:hypothetical protein
MSIRAHAFGLLTASLLVTAPLVAGAAGPSDRAWVWGSNPSAASYTADAKYGHNPADGAITIKRTAPGAYDVSFAGLGARAGSGGNAQVSAYGGGPEHCSIDSWSPAGKDLVLKVRCFKGGAAADTRFSALLSLPAEAAAPSPAAWAWVQNASAPSSTADARYASNGGRPVQVARSAVGRYKVTFTGLKSSAGNVQVSSYGGAAVICSPASWTSSGGNMVVEVSCFNSAGAPTDSRLSILVNP